MGCAKAVRIRPGASYLPVFYAVRHHPFLAHVPWLDLPYFWDEAGYYVPAALDRLARRLADSAFGSPADPSAGLSAVPRRRLEPRRISSRNYALRHAAAGRRCCAVSLLLAIELLARLPRHAGVPCGRYVVPLARLLFASP